MRLKDEKWLKFSRNRVQWWTFTISFIGHWTGNKSEDIQAKL